jgi:hypothetical protein
MSEQWHKLICWLKGHSYSNKLIVALPYAKCFMATCDRCGAGEDDFAVSQSIARVTLRSADARFGDHLIERGE